MNLIKTSRRDTTIMQIILIVIAVIWLFPLLVAVQRSLEFQGLDNYKSLFTNPANGVPITQLISTRQSLRCFMLFLCWS